MFQSFNFNDFLTVGMIYLAGVLITQIYLKKLIIKASSVMGTSTERQALIGLIGVVVGVAAWGCALYFYGWSAGAVFALGAVVEIALTVARRKTIQEAIIVGFGSRYEPLNFNEINGKKL